MQIVIFGASASLAQPIIKYFKKKFKIYLISASSVKEKGSNIKLISLKNYSFVNIKNAVSQIPKKNTVFLFLNGSYDDQPFYKISNKKIQEIIKINLTLPLLATKTVLNFNISNKNKFIYFSSSRALKGDLGIAVYSATKTALNGLVRSFTQEYSNLDQEFYLFSLGLFKGGMESKLTEKVRKKLIDQTPNKKNVNKNDLIKTLKLILNSSALTGSTIKLDNGYS